MDTIYFRPVRGTEANILNTEYDNGCVYFATDTKKIYVDGPKPEDNKIPMGGTSGIYYGNLIHNQTPDPGQTEFEFTVYDIDGNDENSERLIIPTINDLIFNIPDKSFYRVIEVFGKQEATSITATKLAIAGDGEGGGGDSPIPTGKLTLTPITSRSLVTLNNSQCLIEYEVIATDEDGDSTGPYSYEIIVNGAVRARGMAPQGKNTIDVTNYLINNKEDNQVKIAVSAEIGSGIVKEASKIWNISRVGISFTWGYDELNVNNIDKELTLNWNISGTNIENVTRTSIITLENYGEIGTVTKKTGQGNNFNFSFYPNDKNLSHGSHKFTITSTVDINGVIIPLGSITKYIIINDPTDETTIISVPFDQEQEFLQYNTIQIPIIIYKENNLGDVNLEFWEEGEVKKGVEEKCENSKYYYWLYTPSEASNIRTLIIRSNDGSEKTLRIKVTELEIDNEEVSNYAFKFKANELTNNQAVKNWESKGITASFSDEFDWINGGIQNEKDERGFNRQYFCIKAGSKMFINYDLFKQSPKLNGKTFKFIFKATKCRDYDAQILKSDAGLNGGLILNAQNALYSTNKDSLSIAYCEDSYIELELDISPNSTQYIQPWLDGIPTGILRYNSDTSFLSDGNQKIEIGSNDCDVYVYLIKVYEKHLTNDDHISNFIADAPNAEEMIDRYNRNNIMEYDPNNSNNQYISPEKLAKANPGCLVHMYDIPKMTTTKKDKVYNCQYQQLHGSDVPVLYGENAMIKVQGTSSAAYGLAAFNIDTDFNNTDEGNGTPALKDAEGKDLLSQGGWSMNEGSIPCTYFCTKVNVASSENANNALNQEWYNKYQPYKSVWRCKGEHNRDTMEFTPGVMFILDRNKTTNDTDTPVNNNVFKEIDGYVENPYYRMYAICNMGNSKDNIHVLHDSENPKECCIEVSDNQRPQQWMTSDQFIDNNIDPDDGTDDIEFYSFRYPDGREDASPEMIAAWKEFVSWMAHANPQPKYQKIICNSEEEFVAASSYKDIDDNIVTRDLYTFIDEVHELIDTYNDEISEYYYVTDNIYGYTEEKLETEETFEPYTFKGYKADEVIQKNYNPILKGLIIDDYAGTYTHDTYRYRMAKMLNECEDHLVMDSVIYHYLFIERHSMVDNVAKNTFWSTEDLQHWNLTKDYDNDTASGINNRGALTLTYGYEPQDKMDGIPVFNAANSVWFNFCHGLYPACKKMYKALDVDNGAWDSKNYLEAFKQWQSVIPERCWIEDSYRKYIRPLEIYNEENFVKMMEGGKKDHQRKQFDTYHSFYDSSKYAGQDCIKSRIEIRGNTKEDQTGNTLTNGRLNVNMYADCYIQAAFGTGPENPEFSKRVKRGEPVEISPGTTNLGDATIYLFSAKYIQELGDEEGRDLNSLTPKSITVSAADKLSKIVVGSDSNNSITNASLVEIGLKNNEMLEEVYIENCTNTALQTLDLEHSVNLRTVDTQNSAFTSVTLPKGGAVETVLLEKPITINLDNLTKLKTLTINDDSRLTTIRTNNIDNNINSNINSKNILESLLSNGQGILTNYEMLNIDWLIDDDSELDIENKKIPILETLLNDFSPAPDQATDILHTDSESLTGILAISENAYNDSVEIAKEIYDNYVKNDTNAYPNLDIVFMGENVKIPKITILDGDDNVIWYNRIPKNTAVDSDILSNSPVGTFDIEKVKKIDSTQYVYEFDNKWEVYDSEGILKGKIDNIDPYVPADWVTFDMIIKPIFNQSIRTYIVNFYQKENNQDILIKGPLEVDYGTYLKDIIPNIIPYKDESKLELLQAYDFNGYGYSENSNPLDLEVYQITNNSNLYAIFKLVDNIRTVIHPEYFDYNLSSYNGQEGYLIKIKKELELKGKITLPSSYENKPVIGIATGGFGYTSDTGTKKIPDNWGVSHIFQEEFNENLKIIKARGCANSTNLKHFDFNSIESIETHAFWNCKLNPNTLDFSQNTLKFVGSFGFSTGCSASSSNSNCSLNIPSSIENIEYSGFGTLFMSISEATKNNPNNFNIIIGSKELVSNLNLSLTKVSDTGKYVIFNQNNLNSKTNVKFYTNNYASSEDFVTDNSKVINYFIIDTPMASISIEGGYSND